MSQKEWEKSGRRRKAVMKRMRLSALAAPVKPLRTGLTEEGRRMSVSWPGSVCSPNWTLNTCTDSTSSLQSLQVNTKHHS